MHGQAQNNVRRRRVDRRKAFAQFGQSGRLNSLDQQPHHLVVEADLLVIVLFLTEEKVSDARQYLSASRFRRIAEDVIKVGDQVLRTHRQISSSAMLSGYRTGF